MEWIQSFLPISENVRPGLPRTVKYIVVHDTNNAARGATAHAYDEYLTHLAKSRKRSVSWHYTVDEHTIVQHIPDNEVAYHCGDWEIRGYNGGNGAGIGIEMCVNKGADFEKTLQNTSVLIAKLLKNHNLAVDAIRQHHYFSPSKKNCPFSLRSKGRWEEFIQLIEKQITFHQTPEQDPVEADLYINQRIKLSNAPVFKSVYGGVPIRRVSGEYKVSAIVPGADAGVRIGRRAAWVKSRDCYRCEE